MATKMSVKKSTTYTTSWALPLTISAAQAYSEPSPKVKKATTTKRTDAQLPCLSANPSAMGYPKVDAPVSQ